jgi:hypothetical protein
MNKHKLTQLAANSRALVWTMLLLIVSGTQLPAQTADTTSLENKVMAGYQGWFRCAGDRPNSPPTWFHWFNGAPPNGRLAFDTWPDMSELSQEEKYPIPGFFYPDGTQAYLYSPLNYQTVLRHFRWMQESGIDGVWLSQFCSRMTSDYTVMKTVMDHVRKAATETGRTWAYFYDLSGMRTNNVVTVVSNQWVRMVDQGYTSDPRYLHHNGKPALLVWGFFPSRPESLPAAAGPLVDFLLAPGKYQAALVGGGEPFMRTDRRTTPEFIAMLMRMTAWMPWQVGRFETNSIGYKLTRTSHWAGDVELCASNKVLYIPVMYAGTQVAGPPPVPPRTPTVPRRCGNLLWEEFVAASKFPSINSVFVAMFDEVSEGTQIMKVSNMAPTNAAFLTHEGATPDYYMRLVSLGESMLRTHTPITMPIPISPFDTNLWYRIINRSSGLALNNAGGATAGSAMNLFSNSVGNASLQWQLIYNAGYLKIKNRATGKMMTQGADGSLVQSDDVTSDNSKWEFVWDGSGCCRIKSKAGSKMLSCGEAAASGGPIVPVADANSDNLRWQILDY